MAEQDFAAFPNFGTLEVNTAETVFVGIDTSDDKPLAAKFCTDAC